MNNTKSRRKSIGYTYSNTLPNERNAKDHDEDIPMCSCNASAIKAELNCLRETTSIALKQSWDEFNHLQQKLSEKMESVALMEAQANMAKKEEVEAMEKISSLKKEIEWQKRPPMRRLLSHRSLSMNMLLGSSDTPTTPDRRRQFSQQKRRSMNMLLDSLNAFPTLDRRQQFKERRMSSMSMTMGSSDASTTLDRRQQWEQGKSSTSLVSSDSSTTLDRHQQGRKQSRRFSLRDLLTPVSSFVSSSPKSLSQASSENEATDLPAVADRRVLLSRKSKSLGNFSQKNASSRTLQQPGHNATFGELEDNDTDAVNTRLIEDEVETIKKKIARRDESIRSLEDSIEENMKIMSNMQRQIFELIEKIKVGCEPT